MSKAVCHPNTPPNPGIRVHHPSHLPPQHPPPTKGVGVGRRGGPLLALFLQKKILIGTRISTIPPSPRAHRRCPAHAASGACATGEIEDVDRARALARSIDFCSKSETRGWKIIEFLKRRRETPRLCWKSRSRGNPQIKSDPSLIISGVWKASLWICLRCLRIRLPNGSRKSLWIYCCVAVL